jgi:hypothetical protein
MKPVTRSLVLLGCAVVCGLEASRGLRLLHDAWSGAYAHAGGAPRAVATDLGQGGEGADRARDSVRLAALERL